MAWPTDDIVLTNVDQGTDNPSLARPDIYNVFNKVKSILANRGAADGVADLDSSGKLPMARLYTDVANGVAKLDGSSKVSLAQIYTGAGNGLDADMLDGQHGSYYAPLESPAFTGVPTVPQPLPASNSDRIATTAFVQNAVAGFNPTGFKRLYISQLGSNTSYGSAGTYTLRSVSATINSGEYAVITCNCGITISCPSDSSRYASVSLLRGSTTLKAAETLKVVGSSSGTNYGYTTASLHWKDTAVGTYTFYFKVTFQSPNNLTTNYVNDPFIQVAVFRV